LPPSVLVKGASYSFTTVIKNTGISSAPWVLRGHWVAATGPPVVFQQVRRIVLESQSVLFAGKPMNRPVYINIRDDLRARLVAGEWAAGERLPAEADLAANYGVARMTIRQAIGVLASEGAVVRRQGVGTFAVDRCPVRSTNKLLSFAEEMYQQGHQLQAKLIRAAVEQPPPAAREALQLPSSAAAVLIRRVRLVDGCPIIVQNSWLPNARFAGLAADPLLDGSPYATLEANYGVSIARATQVFSVGVADQRDAVEIDLHAGAPVLVITRTAYDASSRAVEFSVSVTRSGYLVETLLECRPRTETPEQCVRAPAP
jgi:GntR family transcriptional regulator